MTIAPMPDTAYDIGTWMTFSFPILGASVIVGGVFGGVATMFFVRSKNGKNVSSGDGPFLCLKTYQYLKKKIFSNKREKVEFLK